MHINFSKKNSFWYCLLKYLTSVWNFLKFVAEQKTEIFLCQMLTMINVWLNSVHIFINYHFHWISFLRSAFVRIHVLVIQRKECITLVNAAFYLLFVHTTCWMKVFFFTFHYYLFFYINSERFSCFIFYSHAVVKLFLFLLN